MSEEEAAELRYEAGMYQSLYELAKERNARLVAALEAAEQNLASIAPEKVRQLIREALRDRQNRSER